MIHLFEKNGLYLVLDVNSGSLHVLSKLAYEILDLCREGMPEKPDDSVLGLAYAREDVIEAYEELLSLKDRELLFAPEIKIPFPDIKYVPVKAMCLHIAHDCNMRCRYCFASSGEYHGERGIMSAETGKQAIDFLLSHSMNRKNLEVDFFGGEPLLGFDAVKEITAYGNKRAEELGKTIRFTLTTNGALLDDETIEWLNANTYNVVLSLDGRKSVNDGMRKFVDGSGTYDDIVPAFQKLVSTRPADRNCYVRGTFTRENLDFANDVMHMVSLGFKELSVEPVTLPDEDPLSIRERDLDKVFAEYDRLTDILCERDDVNFFHFCVDLDAGPCVFKRVKGCGAGSEYIAVTPSGQIYPCHQFAGMSDFLLGDIRNGFREGSDAIRSHFLNTNIFTKPECEKCFAKYFCGGGCCASSYNSNGDIRKSYKIGCELERHRLECALYMKAKKLDDENS